MDSETPINRDELILKELARLNAKMEEMQKDLDSSTQVAKTMVQYTGLLDTLGYVMSMINPARLVAALVPESRRMTDKTGTLPPSLPPATCDEIPLD